MSEHHGLFSHTLLIGEWRVEPQLNRIARDEDDVQLEPKVMHVLLCMAERPGKTITKEHFMDEVWAGTVVTDDVLSRCISELRKALGDDTREPEYIETIRKTGYRLIAPVTVLESDDPSPARVNVPASVSDASSLQRAAAWLDGMHVPERYRWAAVWGVVFLAIGLLLGVLLRGPTTEPVVEEPPETIPFTSYPGVEAEPALSPNGQQVAFVWDGGEDRNESIFVKQSTSETPLQVTSAYANDYSPAWSPDGQQIAFARVSGTTHSIHVASSLGGSERRIARYGSRRVHSLAWSPDTTRQVVAISARTSTYGPFQLELMDLTADSSWAVTSPPPTSIGDTQPSFAPDGSAIAFLRSKVEGIQEVYVVPLENGHPERISFQATRITGLSWDPEGEHLLVAGLRNGNSGLWRVPLTGGEVGTILAISERSDLLRPTLSRSGSRLAYAQEFANTNIWAWERANGGFETRTFATSTRWDSDPAVAPDGDQVAFVSMRSGYRELWRIGRTSQNSVQLTDLRSSMTSSPAWAPDNERIAFVSGEEGSANIYMIDAEGGAPRKLTDDTFNNVMPSWSHDGEWVYFASDRGGAWQIWMVSPTRGHIFPVVEGSSIAAQEALDGHALYLARPDTAGIWRLNLSAHLDVPIVQAAYGGEQANGAPQEEMNMDDELELVVPWLSPHDYANWRLAENGIYFVRRRTDATVLSYYQFSTQNIIDIAAVDDLADNAGFDIAPDGSWFVLAQKDRRESDIILVNNFR